MSCPICHKTTASAYRPFCSKRCSDIDLGKWLSGGYTYSSEQDESQETTHPQAIEKDIQLQ
ncbi:MAG: DNA gyrase inhibitor YacG [Cognatishimia sp.]